MRVRPGLLAVSVAMVVVGALLFWRGRGHGQDGDGGFNITTRLPVQTETTFDWQGKAPPGPALFLPAPKGGLTVTPAPGDAAAVPPGPTRQGGHPRPLQAPAP